MEYENTTEIYTNNREGSVLEVVLDKVTFEELWDKYPSSELKHINSKTSKDEFGNHCAINVSEALYLNKIKMKSFKGVKCYHKCPSGKNVHAIRAQELANWLKKRPFAGCLKPESYTGESFEKKIEGKTGIVFFKDYWQRNGETGETRTGDHIDLWNENELASIGLIATWIRRTFSGFSESWLDMSDLKKSKSVLFWEIK
ncbi:type VI secretion system amidase effector protein Tae4 [Tenacibaculum finnmarkense genomovar finnmarkense]|uniref:type VI secretion system amidase effector protein Tae4 n=1 Tax=Tenacibaculum finnmarkense TaxID=2781243 RepID=UPI001E5E67B3|nr:type VI secretion system amidase effector protein Tae4 [Tenacibaculum finnmarkense]MCD8418756.1 type VI secretion system amidase effector protein Tae4 [Tenacibaculum finnmarkense genomovar finnmarkense]MCG8187062.1 type VI secretion system amidase effector protein Tae4 [Tenacibaculum finnmarkense genomovar finnmarkense]MCG8203613.1 type VI secretion system amidase effector protein Tae4 [Tenacibaculum finnmarkense genomovar finnmarkense]MCG8211098.1 type VI secretion system amidase effector p